MKAWVLVVIAAALLGIAFAYDVPGCGLPHRPDEEELQYVRCCLQASSTLLLLRTIITMQYLTLFHLNRYYQKVADILAVTSQPTLSTLSVQDESQQQRHHIPQECGTSEGLYLEMVLTTIDFARRLRLPELRCPRIRRFCQVVHL